MSYNYNCHHTNVSKGRMFFPKPLLSSKKLIFLFFYLPSTKCQFKLDYLLKAADSDALPIMNAKVTETKTPVCMVSSLNIFFDFKHKLTKEHLK